MMGLIICWLSGFTRTHVRLRACVRACVHEWNVPWSLYLSVFRVGLIGNSTSVLLYRGLSACFLIPSLWFFGLNDSTIWNRARSLHTVFSKPPTPFCRCHHAALITVKVYVAICHNNVSFLFCWVTSGLLRVRGDSIFFACRFLRWYVVCFYELNPLF